MTARRLNGKAPNWPPCRRQTQTAWHDVASFRPHGQPRSGQHDLMTENRRPQVCKIAISTRLAGRRSSPHLPLSSAPGRRLTIRTKMPASWTTVRTGRSIRRYNGLCGGHFRSDFETLESYAHIRATTLQHLENPATDVRAGPIQPGQRRQYGTRSCGTAALSSSHASNDRRAKDGLPKRNHPLPQTPCSPRALETHHHKPATIHPLTSVGAS
jgi:hypothetical protein